MLSLSQQRIFLQLVDKNAQPKAFAVEVGLNLDEVRYHFQYISQYRENISLADKIAEIRRSNLTKKQQEKAIKGLRNDKV